VVDNRRHSDRRAAGDGGSAANMLAYDQAKEFSRHPERFGTGVPEGIASESSNNANVGGSLVTIMAFGIPGDAVTAVWRVRLSGTMSQGDDVG
jgi:TctA family transporter